MNEKETATNPVIEILYYVFFFSFSWSLCFI